MQENKQGLVQISENARTQAGAFSKFIQMQQNKQGLFRIGDQTTGFKLANPLCNRLPQVRLEFINTWLKTCDPETVPELLTVLDHEVDPYIEFALRNVLRHGNL